MKVGDLVKASWGADMAVVLELVNFESSNPYAKLQWVRASDGFKYVNVFPVDDLEVVSASR